MNSRVSWLNRAKETAAATLSEMLADPTGRFEPSVYETGRLVSLTPALAGHEQRVNFLLAQQKQDGRWGGPDDYHIVPTLSATEALLAEQHRPGADPRVRAAAERGVRALARRLSRNGSLPDTVAVEIVVPGLVDDINAHLLRRAAAPLPVPDAASAELLATLRAAVAQGHGLPEKLAHSLEVIGEPARGASFVTPVDGRIVGCSPAATAVWLGNDGVRDENHPCVGYLRQVTEPEGGVPVAAPLALFERSWVLSTLSEAGLSFTAPAGLVASLHSAFGEQGAAGGLGLPADADDTATALYALAKLGSPRSPECLWNYDAGDHFACFPEERTPSTSTNAHVLQAIGASLAAGSAADVDRYRAAAWRVTRWLADTQQLEGHWDDKWHASPYYATVCCATALAAYGTPEGVQAVRRAVDWVMRTQRDDGSWGHWSSTREETAYGVRTLLRAGEPGDHEVAAAAARGAAFLLESRGEERHPPLWHDKDLYTPTRIVDTEVFAALYLAHTDARVADLLLAAGHGVQV
ncbi:hypothetical protein SacmaDRAFT_1173 [Saccharomonospora marina XMU15]|uniref:Squalene cyclase C-terminal domain-containing protein n=1 Tax=Saccharomonospora marina XMU15 TaxID=882083 RepID=H5WXC7_9PSEU|nr:prenyltransferase/squalene oxidase repeat-containing protein [Saccharomonospora marina]EHR49456.1 hypothetical protein SacmaDRAFT_1173 [Saccharomonospora marina XMU15]